MSDQMDLLVEQVKMLSGEIAFSTSTLKRLVEQSVTDPESSKTQVKFHLWFACLCPISLETVKICHCCFVNCLLLNDLYALVCLS